MRKVLFIGLVLILAMVTGAYAADFPKRDITSVVVWGAGGGTDTCNRIIAAEMQQFLGVNINVINKTGGVAGSVGMMYGYSRPHDGYTLTGLSESNVTAGVQGGWDKNFNVWDVFIVGGSPDVISVTPDTPYKTLKDLVAAAGKAPGATTFSGSGTNSANHLAQQRFDKLAGIKTTYVPFKGTGASNTALLGKQVSGAWSYTTVSVQLGNQVRCLGVAMEKRHSKLPNCPTFKEQGYNLVSGAYRGIAVPKSTPATIQKQLSDLIGKINKDPEFIKKMEDKGFAMIDVPLSQMDAFMAERKAEYGAIAREMGIVKKK